MRKIGIAVIVALLLIPVITTSSKGEQVTIEEALIIANNWVNLMIEKTGSWGIYETAEVVEIQEFKRGSRTIGYVCHVEPKGYIVISLFRELTPIQAYSETSNIDPKSDEGMVDVIKWRMESILDAIEDKLGKPIEQISSQELQNLLDYNYLDTWNDLEDIEKASKRDHSEGEIMLTTEWDQKPPYNNYCENLSCSYSAPNDCNENAKVGCVATAAAQIMRYWSWPAWGELYPCEDTYDWPNMINDIGCSSPEVQQTAIAELCAEIGYAVEMDYGCDVSTSLLDYDTGPDMLDAYEDYFRYHDDCDSELRWHYLDSQEWYNVIKENLNLNRPVQYGMFMSTKDGGGQKGKTAHSMACDGWKESGGLNLVHMNYGWDNDHTAWHDIDDLNLSTGHEDEMILRNIYPEPSLSSQVTGLYPCPEDHPYRYFDQDCSGHNATFGSQRLQCLPNIVVECNGGNPDDRIRFEGYGINDMIIFTNGNESTGIRVNDEGFELYLDGSFTLY